MATTLHLRIDADPQTLCGRDPQAKGVAWARPEMYQELMDGEIQGLEGCTTCTAKLAEKVINRGTGEQGAGV